MAAKLLSGTAQGITGFLGPLATDEIKLLWGVKGEIQKLKDTVSTIEGVLLDAEKKHAAGEIAVTRWLGRLEDAIFDADDLLDVVSTEALQRQIMTREKKAKQVRKQVRIFFSKSNQLVYRIKMAHKIKAIRERLDAIATDREKFHLVVCHVEETRVGGNSDRGNTHSSECARKVFGREDDMKTVMNRLLDPNVVEKVSILPIVGFGGLGKTTLAKLIFNDKQIKEGNFVYKMWVCVSDPFNVKDVVEKILEVATNTKQEAVQMEILVSKLKEIINGKKYLLVLDDVWNESYVKWSSLKDVLMVGAEGSRILVTTRTEKVARICGTVESYFLSGLKEHASWSLFKQIAFEKREEPDDNSSIAAIGREILAKCFGVPLAITTIGSLLRDKNSEEWSSFKNIELSKISENEEDIIPTLKLSYDQLPSHLKHCFAYCCLFPKDYDIERSALIQLWIAQGFIKLSDQNQCLEDVGDDYFKDLLERSFLQEDKRYKMRYKMHDLMHDLARLVAGSMITALDGTERKVVDEKTRHVSVVGSDINALSITTSLCKASSKRTLLCSHVSNNFWGESDCKEIFSSSKFLRVLDLHKSSMDFLPSSIGKLKHLRYLDLSWNKDLKKLPNSITELQNLQTLRLSWCEKLEELPRDIKKLVSLRHLEIDECDGLTYMPRGLGKLNNLQTLTHFVANKDPFSKYISGLSELNGLNNLRGELCIQNLRHVKDVASECKAANLKGKNHLDGLRLEWSREGGGRNDSDANVVDDEVLLENLEPPPNLKDLYLEGNYGSWLPSWLLSLENLKYLELYRLYTLEYILDNNEFSSSSSILPSLKRIELTECPILKGWWRRRDSSVEVKLPSFPRLSVLWISDCPMLTSMPMFLCLEELFLYNASWKPVQQTMMMNMAVRERPTSTATTSSLSTPLSKLKSVELHSVADLETLSEESLKNLVSLNSLTIRKCNRLKSLSPGIQHLTALQDLELSDCLELELANDEDGMQWQGLKSLHSLTFTHLPKFVSLPRGLQHVTTLNRVKISNCVNLTAIPKWNHRVRISNCVDFTAVPEWNHRIHNCTSLQGREIDGCSLPSVPIEMRRMLYEGRFSPRWPPSQSRLTEIESQSILTESDSDAEEAVPAKAHKKQSIWSRFKKSRALNS